MQRCSMLTYCYCLAVHQLEQLINGQVHQPIPIWAAARVPAPASLQRGGLARPCSLSVLTVYYCREHSLLEVDMWAKAGCCYWPSHMLANTVVGEAPYG